jgi:hypothetical protein
MGFNLMASGRRGDVLETSRRTSLTALTAPASGAAEAAEAADAVAATNPPTADLDRPVIDLDRPVIDLDAAERTRLVDLDAVAPEEPAAPAKPARQPAEPRPAAEDTATESQGERR